MRAQTHVNEMLPRKRKWLRFTKREKKRAQFPFGFYFQILCLQISFSFHIDHFFWSAKFDEITVFTRFSIVSAQSQRRQ